MAATCSAQSGKSRTAKLCRTSAAVRRVRPPSPAIDATCAADYVLVTQGLLIVKHYNAANYQVNANLAPHSESTSDCAGKSYKPHARAHCRGEAAYFP